MSARFIIAVSLILLLLFNSFHVQAQESYSESSWALGVVIPEGSQLSGGNTLQWENVANVTAVAVLPNITQPDNIVYAVLSLMTNDSVVMQVAAGIFPNESTWLVYSWLFTNLTSTPVKYQWVLNRSTPSMSPNDAVSLSIYRSETDIWNLKVVDLETDSYVERTFPPNIASTLKVGDQEVFAFESYSRSAATFEYMGNFTLKSLLVDGLSVSNGLYAYGGGWNPGHNPLFVIGTLGTTPPIFISLTYGENTLAVWSYTNPWTGSNLVFPDWIETMLIPSIIVCSVIALAALVTIRKSN